MEHGVSDELREKLLAQLLKVLRSTDGDLAKTADKHECSILDTHASLWKIVASGTCANRVQRLLLWKACFLNLCQDFSLGASTVDYGILRILSDNIDTCLRVYVVDSWLFIVPLCLHIMEQQAKLGSRLLVAVGGVAAAGKTTWCQLVKAVLTFLLSDEGRLFLPNGPVGARAVVLGMDAFHYTNERLVELGLRTLKGRPETFNAAVFTSCVQQVKTQRDETLFLPAYDRSLHNPVPNTIAINKDVTIVLIEGIFSLLEGHGFHALKNYDISIFLHIDKDMCQRRAVERKARTNQISKPEALAHYKRVDGHNYELITSTKEKADICFSLSSTSEDSFHIEKFTLKEGLSMLLS